MITFAAQVFYFQVCYETENDFFAERGWLKSCPIFVEKALELPLGSRKTIKTNARPTVSFRRISRLGKSESNVYG